MDNRHLVPQLILDIVSDLKKANAGAELNYLTRLEVIREYIDHELASFHLKTWRAPKGLTPFGSPAKKEKR